LLADTRPKEPKSGAIMRGYSTARVMEVDEAAIRDAAACLAGGGLVAFPTETVYGLGADATSARAVARLYAAKGRPRFNPLISHVAGLGAARELAELDETAVRLAAAFWPGALTIVGRKTKDCPVCELATAGLDTIAVRIPDHPVARGILARFGRPVVAPSANISGHVSPTRAEHVVADLGHRIDLVVDGGPTSVGIESTIVACAGGRTVLLRPGGISRDAIERAVGRRLDELDREEHAEASTRPVAPGMLASHYAPKARLRLEAAEVRPGEALLAFGPALPAGADRAADTLNLSRRGDLLEAAASLFAHLRALDAGGTAVIAVMPIPREGLGEAINDRLARAAAPRGSAAG
jgi:L-threonylcarbamoyladenylate synthase